MQTGEEVRNEYEKYLRASYLNLTELFLYELCYDTIWTLARALNKTIYGKFNISIYID